MEENSTECGINELIAKLILEEKINEVNYNYLATNGYPSGLYGSQKWHQTENGLNGEPLKNKILTILNA